MPLQWLTIQVTGFPPANQCDWVIDLAFSPQLRLLLGLPLVNCALKMAAVFEALSGTLIQEAEEQFFFAQKQFWRVLRLWDGDLSTSVDAQIRGHGAVSLLSPSLLVLCIKR